MPRRRSTRICTVPGCTRPHLAADLCRLHYQRQYRHGDPSIVLPPYPVKDAQSLLAVLRQHGPMSRWRLSQVLHTHNRTTQRLLDELHRDGHIHKMGRRWVARSEPPHGAR